MAKKATKKKYRLTEASADAVAERNPQVVEVIMAGCKVEARRVNRREPPPAIVTNVGVNASSESAQTEDGNDVQVVSAQCKYTLMAYPDADHDEEALRIECEYAAIYNVDGRKPFTETQLLSYAQQYALRLLWPYFSEFIHTTTVRMGMPPLRIPLFEKVRLTAD